MKRTTQLYILLFSCLFFIVSIFILSTINNKNQTTTSTEFVKTIELKNNLNLIPKYFKKIVFKYDNTYSYDYNYSTLILRINEKYNAKLLNTRFIYMDVYYIYDVSLNNFKKTKTLKKIRYEIKNENDCNC